MSELRTLILTPSMVPHRVCSWQDGVVVWYQEKGEILASYEATVSSQHLTLRIPAVVHLTKQIKRDNKKPKFSRSGVYMRDHYTCQYCGEKKPAKDLTYDHVLPRCRGGQTNWTSITTACRKCNMRKGRRTPEEAGMRLLSKPRAPKTLPHAGVLIDVEACPSEWLPFLGVEAREIA